MTRRTPTIRPRRPLTALLAPVVAAALVGACAGASDDSVAASGADTVTSTAVEAGPNGEPPTAEPLNPPSSAAPAPAPASEVEPEPTEVDQLDAYPSAQLSTTTGGQIDFGSLAGQDVVLWFWAPW